MTGLLPAITRRSLSIRLGLPLILAAVALAVAMVVMVRRQQVASAESQAQRQAEAVIAQTLATRSVYTSAVVGKLKADEAPVGFSPEFADNPGQIPLPATLIHRISDVVNGQGLYSIDLISPWPINP